MKKNTFFPIWLVWGSMVNAPALLLEPEFVGVLLPDWIYLLPGVFDPVEPICHIPPLLEERLFNFYATTDLVLKHTYEEVGPFLEQARKNTAKSRALPSASCVPAPLTIDLKPVIDGILEIAKLARTTDLDPDTDTGGLSLSEYKYKTLGQERIDGYIKVINEALKEAKEKQVFSSDDIEEAHFALVQATEAFDLMDGYITSDLEFESKRFESPDAQRLAAHIKQLRTEYGNGDLKDKEHYLDVMAHIRGYLSDQYKECHTIYEIARSEMYYLLRRIRKEVGWTEEDLDNAIIEAKHLAQLLFKVPVYDWGSLMPEVPYTRVRGFEVVNDVKGSKNGISVKWVHYPHNLYKLPMYTFDTPLLQTWTALCEILEHFHEENPSEKSEELYGLLLALTDHSLIGYSKSYHFLPWFDPAKYSPRCRLLHLSLHYLRAATYAQISNVFAYDVLRMYGRLMEQKHRDRPSTIDQALISCWTEAWILEKYVYFNFRDTKKRVRLHNVSIVVNEDPDIEWTSILETMQRQMCEFAKVWLTIKDQELDTFQALKKALFLFLPHMLYRANIARGLYALHPEESSYLKNPKSIFDDEWFKGNGDEQLVDINQVSKSD